MSSNLPKSSSLYQTPPKTVVEMQNLWKVMDDIQALAEVVYVDDSLTGYVQSVTGLDTDNTDPQNPIVQIAVDGVTITGTGTSGDPLVAATPSGFVETVTDDGNGVVSVDNTDPVNPIIEFNGVNIGTGLSGDGTSGSPLVSTITQYTDEMAQDAVGNILTDSSTIDFTYNDAAPSISAIVIDDSITFSKIQNITTDRLLGRDTALSGDVEEISIGTGLAFDGAGTLNCTVSSYTDEQAQDAVGTILTDSSTVDLTYNDGVPSITAAVINNSSIQKIEVVKNSGAVVGTRKQLNFIEGAGTTLTIADDGGNDQVDITVASSITQYTDEMAQDAVGGILTDSTTIDLTYNDATPSITASAITQMSITSDGSGLKLSGDLAAPGNYKYYGTDSAGTKGYNAVIKKQLVYMQCQQSNYPDATTLYFGNFNFTPITALTSRVNVYFRSAGTITLAEIYWCSFATAGTNENLSIYIRLNDTTDYLVQTIGSTDARKTFTNSAINIPIAAGDFITGKIVTPTWATNPTTVVIAGYLEFQSTV